MNDVRVPEAIWCCPFVDQEGTKCGKAVLSKWSPSCQVGHPNTPMVRVPVRPAADGDRLADAARNLLAGNNWTSKLRAELAASLTAYQEGHDG